MHWPGVVISSFIHSFSAYKKLFFLHQVLVLLLQIHYFFFKCRGFSSESWTSFLICQTLLCRSGDKIACVPKPRHFLTRFSYSGLP